MIHFSICRTTREPAMSPPALLSCATTATVAPVLATISSNAVMIGSIALVLLDIDIDYFVALPEDEAWLAVRDRLVRATRGEDDDRD